jgi:hypothetical protein
VKRTVADALVVSALVLGLPCSAAPAQHRLFDSDEPLSLRFEVDLRTLVNDRDSLSATYHDATLTYRVGDGNPVSFDARLRTRGHWRRQRANCDFPPLRLDVPRGRVGETVFAGQNRLKLVTPCIPGRKEYEEYVLREFLVYQLYNLLTPLSLRVRLARTTYVDTRGRMDSLSRTTFLIEDPEQMAARNDASLLDLRGARFADMDSLQMGLVGVFLYLIGQTDWSLRGLHNIELVRERSRVVHHPVAYDFDLSGIVSTRYARPDPRLRLFSVRDRLYRGPCLRPEHWDAVLARFRDRKAAIYALYQNRPDLTPRYVDETIRFLDGFYQVIDDPAKAARELIRRCSEEETILPTP